MTNKFNNWERIEEVLAYVKKSANAFAVKIGMLRSESIYHIKRGAFGISYDLTERITAQYPEINPTWLLSGVGSLLRNTRGKSSSVPFYEGDITEVLRTGEVVGTSLGQLRLPYMCDCDIVVRSTHRSMLMPGNAAVDLFLKRVAVEDMVQGNEYVIVTDDDVVWRKIRSVRGAAEQWRLVAMDRGEYPDTVVNRSDIRATWRVISRMTILVS